MDFRGAWGAAGGIESAVRMDEARVLYRLASEAPERVVEIGSWRGRSTVLLAHAVRGRGLVYAIDPFDGSVGVGGSTFAPRIANELRGNLRRLAPEGTVEFIQRHSVEVAQSGEIDDVSLLWVDGDHSLAGTLGDWRAWLPRLRPGAKVALHDRHFPGPARVIEVALRDGWSIAEGVRSLVVLAPPEG